MGRLFLSERGWKMRSNGRRRWRKTCMRELIGRHARRHPETGAYALPEKWFTPRDRQGGQ